MNEEQISARKQHHIDINLSEDVTASITNGFEKYRLIHCALPEINLSQIDISTDLFNHQLDNPLLISSMTGGTERAGTINLRLAKIAQEFKIAMGVGSQRIGIQNKSAMASFNVRKYAPDILLFANLGAVQLNYSYTLADCQRAVEAIDADALFLHLNPLQEALMTGGDTNFYGLLTKIEGICRDLSVPVIVKEVGGGISAEVAEKLFNVGISAIDVAGAGGTSWSEVERHRTKDPVLKDTAFAFRGWGIPTAESLLSIKREFPASTIFASGGMRTGIDVVKALAMGAALGGMASPFLKAATISEKELWKFTQVIIQQIRIAMFCVGAKTLKELGTNKIEKVT